MKILHTSDLHLGKNLLEESLYEDQKEMLQQLINIIINKQVDVLIILGDIYDKSIPSTDAVNLFNNFLESLATLKVDVLITSGNHDSRDRLSFGSNIFNKLNIHIVTDYRGEIYKFYKDDVVFYMLPFIKPFHLKHIVDEETYEKITSSNEMMKWIFGREKIDKSKKNILLAHQFVINKGEEIDFSDSESATNVGTIDAIDVNLLDNFDYVALGHLHRPQKVKRDTIRYSGTPLKYSFSETSDNKSVVIIDTNDMSLEFIPVAPLRKLRVITGTFDSIMKMEASDDLIKVVLEDDTPLVSPMDEIKKKFPNALSLSFASRNNSTLNDINNIDISKEASPLELFNEFFKLQHDRTLTEGEQKYLETLINNLEEE